VQDESTSSGPTGPDARLLALQNQLEITKAQLQAKEAELEAKCCALDVSHQELLEAKRASRETALEILKLKHRIDWLCRKLFGKSSEKLDESQLTLVFEQLAEGDVSEGATEATAPVETDSAEPRPGEKKRGHGRRPLPETLPRRRVVIEVPAEERTCSCCRGEMTPFGEDVKQTLDYEPAKITVVETVRVKYSCPACHEGVVVAPVPEATLAKGLPEAGMLAYVAVSKYADHLPLYRLERILMRSGVSISRNTLGDWIDHMADTFSPVVEEMKKKILKGPIVQSDDTKVRVLGGPDGSYAGYLWCYGGLNQEIVFDFTDGRSREGPLRFLDWYEGYLQVDAYAGYDELFRKRKVVEVGCWAHARRKIFEARTTDPRRADPLLALIASLYAVETEAKGLPAERRKNLRGEKSAPLLAKIHDMLRSTRTDALPKSPISLAAGYALNQWEALNRYLQDGRLAIDNNATERALRGVAVGRKNWLFTGSEAGGRRAAALYSLVESCRRLHLDPFSYIRDVLPRIAPFPAHQVEKLTPAGWKVAFPDQAAAAAIPAVL